MQDVKARWKVIKDIQQPVEGSQETKQDSSKDKSKEPKGKDKPKDSNQNSSKESKDTKDKSKSKDSSKEPRDKNKDNTKDSPKDNKGRQKASKSESNIQSTEPPILSGEEASSEASASDSLPSPQRQKAFLTSHIHSHLYPPSIAPAPDAHFSQRDCDVLASADSRYKRARWLEMQANFFNVTGRMVPLEIIRNKVQGARSLTADLARLEVAGKAESTESWVNGLQ